MADDVEINYTTRELCNKFTDEIIDEENVDVYQLCAVVCAVDQNIKQRSDTRKCEKMCYYSKAIVCFCFQTVILAMMVVQYSINSYNKQEEEQTKYNTDEIKITAAFFASLYISFSIVTWWLEIELNGLYVIEHREGWINCPKYVNKWWIYIGLHANALTLLFGLIGSNILLFWAADAFDVILNCVAVFFMVQIDNEIVGKSDYENLRNWISDFRQEFEQKTTVPLQISNDKKGQHETTTDTNTNDILEESDKKTEDVKILESKHNDISPQKSETNGQKQEVSTPNNENDDLKQNDTNKIELDNKSEEENDDEKEPFISKTKEFEQKTPVSLQISNEKKEQHETTTATNTEDDNKSDHKSPADEITDAQKQDVATHNNDKDQLKQNEMTGSSTDETNGSNNTSVESVKDTKGTVKRRQDALYLECNKACIDFKGEGNNSGANDCCDCMCNAFALILVGIMWASAFFAPVIITVLPFILNKCCLD